MGRSRVLQALTAACVLVAVLPAGAAASATQESILQDDNQLLYSSPSHVAEVLGEMASLGVERVRVSVIWALVAPDPDSRTPPQFDAANPAAYPPGAWTRYDDIVEDAQALGIGVDFNITSPDPDWAATAPSPSIKFKDYSPSPAEFGQFVQAVGTRYSGSYLTPTSSPVDPQPPPTLAGVPLPPPLFGTSTTTGPIPPEPLPRVDYWEIWNEPNQGGWLAPQWRRAPSDDAAAKSSQGWVEESPVIYRRLLAAAWNALSDTGHGGDTILIGETAPRGADVPGVANGMVPLRFLRGLYCVDSSYQQLRGAAVSALGCPATAAASQRFRAANPALFDATGFADHAYPLGQVAPPNVPAPSSEPDWAGLADIAKLEGTLDRLNEVYGSHTQLPIYNTEFGFQTDPPQSECGCVFLSPATAARYLNWSEFIEFGNPRLRSYAQYLLYDAPGPPGHVISESDFSSGLMTVNGIAKPGYSAFRLPIYLPVTSTRPGRSLEVWGDVRPAAFAKHDTGSSQRAAIQFKPSSGGAFTTLASVTITNPAGYFEVPVKFPSSGSVRLEWTYPHGFAFLPPMTPRTVTSREQAITIS